MWGIDFFCFNLSFQRRESSNAYDSLYKPTTKCAVGYSWLHSWPHLSRKWSSLTRLDRELTKTASILEIWHNFSLLTIFSECSCNACVFQLYENSCLFGKLSTRGGRGPSAACLPAYVVFCQIRVKFRKFWGNLLKNPENLAIWHRLPGTNTE